MARQYQIKRSGAPASGIDYPAVLNAEQYAAVSSPAGRALVIAGAGSGKTRTLTYRVAWLLDHGVEPREILLLTFTNKAAREMVGRVKELIARDTSDLWAGTFHSIGSRILRRHAGDIGFTRAFTILDRDDQRSMLGKVVAAREIDTREKRFPKPDVLASLFSLADNTGADLTDIVARNYAGFTHWLDEIRAVKDDYVQRKEETNSMDFDDLLVRTVQLLENRPDLLQSYRHRFRHVLVDEYQDTNRVQSRFIDLLVGGGGNLMAVGDDAQSIYSWRGADMGHILGFCERYPEAKVFTIETNYRSVPEILDLSNEAIRANEGRYEKNLRAERAGSGVRPAMVVVNDPRMQAAFVVQRLGELAESGVPWSEMAVLYRAHFQSLELQMELTAQRVPFAITSGLRFFEQAHIKDVAAFLRLVANPRDEESFTRMVQLLPGCGPAAAGKLWQEWIDAGLARLNAPPPSWSAILRSFRRVPRKAVKHWDQLSYTLDELTPGGSFARPAEMIFSVLEGVYRDHLEAAFDNAEQRLADLDQLSRFGATFDNLNDFLEQLSLLGSVDGEPGADPAEEQDRLTLSSIHQAKGLEWQAVFVIGLVDGQFPIGRVLEREDQAALEEERRLFYVAVTRAKDELYLTYPLMNPKGWGGDVICQPSRFLSDFSPERVEEWKIGAASDWGNDLPF